MVVRLDAGGFLGAGWGVRSYRIQLETLSQQGSSFVDDRNQQLDSWLFVRTTLPVAGPLLTLEYGGELARREAFELILTSGLQAVGLAALTYRAYFSHEAAGPPAYVEMSLSPLAAGRLGISMTLLW